MTENEIRMDKLAKAIERLMKANRAHEAFEMAAEWHRMAGH
jgi:hypothetical protein